MEFTSIIKASKGMKLTVINKYLKIYWYFLKFSLIRATTYRASFFIEFFLEIGYSVVLIIFFNIIYSNVNNIAGWNYHETMFLLGLTTIFSEIFLCSVMIFNLNNLPKKILDGEIDFDLTKPLNKLFKLSLGDIYIAGFPAIIPGIYLIIFSLPHLNTEISLFKILVILLMLLSGFILAYSIAVIMSSFCFVFLNGRYFPRIATDIILYSGRPHTIFFGVLKILFTYLIPVAFMISIPARTFLTNVDIKVLFESFSLAFVFFILAIFTWKHFITKYESASS